MSTPPPSTTSVAIAGAGPTGLVAAIVLADAGVDFVLLDRLAADCDTSRAVVMHARTLEVLAEFGLADELVSRGLRVSRATVRDGTRTLATIPFDGLPTPYPYMLMVPQDITEQVLLGRLNRDGVRVHRPYRVTELAAGKGHVTVGYIDGDGSAGSLETRYLIGADGMHSIVREQAGIGFTGGTYPASFILGDVRMDWAIPRDTVALLFSPDGVTVVVPLPDDIAPNRYRVVATVAAAPEHPTRVDIQDVLDGRCGHGAAKVHEVLWSSRFRIHHRIADRYRADRVLLAGDAAHVHSPAGGQGMNTGIQDAVVLGRLLARVDAGEPDTVLDTYERARRPIATDVLAFTDRMTRVATLRSRPARLLRNGALFTLAKIPTVRTDLACRLAELTVR